MKIHILIIAICLSFFSLLTNAQTLNFQNLADMNLKRSAITTAADSNYIYVSNGFSSTINYTSQIERYDIVNNTWSIFTNLTIPKRYPSSAIVGNNLYLFNGYDSLSICNNKMEVVNLVNGSITLATNNPQPAYYSAAAVWDSIIYIVGGSINATTCTNKLFSFNTINQAWTELASMPEAKQTKGEIIDGKLYILGGFDGTNNSNRIDMYDISNNTWTNLGYMSDSISAFATAVYGSKIYLIGSYSNQKHLASYDVNTNTYSILQETNMIGRRHCGAEIINGKLYIMGGNQSTAISSSLSSLQTANLLSTGFEIKEIKEASIYPNPTKYNISVTNITKPTIIRFYNFLGNLVIEREIESNTVIDLSNLMDGIYNIITEDLTGRSFRKLVVLK